MSLRRYARCTTVSGMRRVALQVLGKRRGLLRPPTGLAMELESPYVVFTDLDGTLLDHDTYSHRDAKAALEALRARNVPLVFCTSKTRAEVERIRAELENHHPFIVENGGAVYIPQGYFPFPIPQAKAIGGYLVIEIGVPHARVMAALRRAARASGCRVASFHNASVRDVAARCRLTTETARLAKQREYDEPFEILTRSPAAISGLLEQIEAQGLSWVRGGRFYHVRGRHNKGQAAEVLVELFRRSRPQTITAGLGDSPNDISLPQVVDVPIIIPLRGARGLRSLSLPRAGLRVAEDFGPRGWNRAVLQLLDSAESAARVRDC